MIHIYRLAHWAYAHNVPLIPRVLYILNRILFSVVLPPSVRLGKDVVLGYSGLGIVIHARCVIGNRVVIGTNVTIGGCGGHYDVPTIEDDVEIGSGAKILGPITIGCGAKIGANAVVLCDVPEYATYVGVPARAVDKLKSTE
jgi:serine O-acetyltransferase